MFQKFILKRLSIDDLGFFKFPASVQNTQTANGIKLQHKVLVSELYPSLSEILENKQNKIMMTVNIYGPGLAPKYTIQRKLLKRLHNNYHLTGELIDSPEDDPQRFRSLQPGDFVIFDFVGNLEPNSARAVFIAQVLGEDSRLHQSINTYLGSRSMIALQSEELERLINNADLPEQHPANLLILEAKLEDASLGGIEGVRALRSGPFRGKVSPQDLEAARRNAQKIGGLGEEFIFEYLASKVVLGEIQDFQWEAYENAISPYDFSIHELDGTNRLIDVKATKGNFSNRIHVSYNELLQMAEAHHYDLYRVFNIIGNSAQLRIARDMKDFAETIVRILQELPDGIQPDGISFSPSDINFEETTEISLTLDDE